jgi:hypothetical protein
MDYTCDSFHLPGALRKHYAHFTWTRILSLSLGGSLVVAQPVTTMNLENADDDNSSWLTYGRDYYGQRCPSRADHARERSSASPRLVFATGGRTADCRRRL